MNLSATFSSLTPNTTYYAQVATAPAGPFTSLGSTVTWLQPPSSVYFDEITTHSIVAAAYAPTPAFSNLNIGLSGTNVARDGVYAGWHGESWMSKAAMPTARYAYNAAALDGMLYAPGGYTTGVLATHVRYDPIANAWTTRTALPVGRDAHITLALGGLVYAVAGETSVGLSSAVTAYDPAGNAWTSRSSFPLLDAGLSGAVLAGKLHGFGGSNGSNLVNHYAYDVDLNSWTPRASMPSPRQAMMTGVVAGKAYVSGGINVSTLSANVEYDPSLDTWTVKAPMPTGRYYHVGAALGGKVYALGGETPAVSAVNEEYDPASDAWTTRAPMPTARTRAGVAVIGGRLYVAGGANGAALSTHEVYDPGVAQQFVGLQPNTQYTFKAKARNLAGIETGETANFSTYTLAAVPGSFAFTFVGASSASLQWTVAGNPGGTEFQAALAVSSSFASASTTPWTANMVSAVFPGLSAGTTYFARVRARNAVGVPTDYTALLSTQTTFAAVAGCGMTRDVRKGGPGYGNITAALAAVPSVLTQDTCVVVRDSATYAEQVTVQGKAPNNFRLRIMRDPALSTGAAISPPAASTAAFRILNSSVTLEGLRVLPTVPVSWGVVISSPDALLTSMLIQTTVTMSGAGLELNAWGRVEFSTVSVGQTRGVYTSGAQAHHNTLYRSSFTNASATNHAVWLTGSFDSLLESAAHNTLGTAVMLGGSNHVMDLSTATSNGNLIGRFASFSTSMTVTRSYFASPTATFGFLLVGAWHTLSQSTVSMTSPAGAAVTLSEATRSTVSKVYAQATVGSALSLQAGSSLNLVEGSTFVALGAIQSAVISASTNNTLSGSIFRTAGTIGLLLSGAHFNSVKGSTITSLGALEALGIQSSSQNVVEGCHIHGAAGGGARINNDSYGNVITQSRLISNSASNYALYLETTAGNSILSSRIENTAGYAAFLGEKADGNLIDLSTVTAQVSGYSALYLDNAATNTFTRSYFANEAGNGVTFGAGASSNTLSMSTVTSSGAAARALSLFMAQDSFVSDSWILGAGYGAYAELSQRALLWRSTVTGSGAVPAFMVAGSSGVVLRDSYVAGPDALNIYSSSATSIERSQLRGTGASGRALQFLQGSNGLSLASATLSAAAIGLVVEDTGRGPLAVASMTVTASTGIQLQGGVQVATFTGVAFPLTVTVSVDAAGLGAASRVTMRDASGERAGTLHETDPKGVVAWFPDMNPPTPPAAPAGCATTLFVRKAGGLDCTGIQGCVDQIPTSPLAGDACVLVTDAAVYPESVVVFGQQPNGFRIRIMGTPGAARPTVNPPFALSHGFGIYTASVSVTDINVVPTNTLTHGVFAYSPYVELSSMSIDSGGKISGAGIFLSSAGAVSHASITVQNADGIRVGGIGNTVSFTTVTSGGKAFYLHGASSTTVQDSFAYGMYGVFLYHSHRNTFSRTAMRKLSATAGGAGLFMNDASSNVITGSFVSNAGGTGADLFLYANANLIELSTITAAGSVYTALELGHGSGNRISRVYAHSASGNASTLSSGVSETLVEHSTFTTAFSGAAALSTNGSSDTFSGNMLYSPNGNALALNGSSTTVSRTTGFSATASFSAFYVGSGGPVSVRDSSFANAAGDGGRIERASYVDIVRSTMTGAGTGAGLKLAGASSNTVTASRLAAPGGPGLSVGSYLELFDMSTVTGTGNAFSGLTLVGSPAVRLTVARGVSLDSSVLETNPGGIGLETSNDVLVATFTGLRFEGGDYGGEALSLPAGSRLTMRDASGALAGTLHELDPRSVVDWVPDPAPSATPNTCGDVLVVRSGGGGDCTSIQACVDLIPSAPLSADLCLFIADSAVYQEPVVVSGKQPAGRRLRIEGLSRSARPVIQGNSTESVLIDVRVASVTLRNLHLNFPTALGLVISSPNALVENVYVEQWVSDPGITLSSWTTLSNSSVSVSAAFGGSGILVTGVGSSVSASTVSGNGGFALADASSNTLSGLYSDNGMCYGMTVERSDFNSVSLSTFIGQGGGCAALHVFGGTYNDFDRLYLYDAAGPAVYFDTFMGQNAGNSIRRSTAVSDSPSDPAVSLYSAEGFTLSDSWVDGEAGALYANAGSMTVSRSTLTTDSATAPGLTVSAQSGFTPQTIVERSHIRGSTGAFFESVDRASLSDNSFAATAPDGIALRIYSGLNVTLAENVLSAPPQGAGLSLQTAENLVVAGMALNAPMHWKDYVTAELSSVTFRDLPAGATALILLSADNFTATFTAAAFTGSLATNVDARLAGLPSRVTMRGASGPRAGPPYEADPSSLVDWLGVSGSAPAAPTPVLTALGISSLTWTWAEAPGVWSYDVRSADGVDPLGSASTGLFTLSGLTPASTYSIRLAVQGSDGSQTLSSPSTGHTLAAPPSGFAALFVTQSSASVQWSLNGNPAGTFAELQRSTDAAIYIVRSGTLSTTAFDTGLLGCTSYYYRVRNRNPVGIDSDFDGPLFVRTPASTPSAPGDLSAQSVPGRSIALTWNPSATEGIVAYRLYKDSGTGTVDYSAPYAEFSAATLSTTTVALSTGSIHLFGLRAVHRCGTEESNTHAVASAWALESLDGVRASIKVPATGKKISGNRVLVMAELDTGSSNDVSTILFQYRSTGTAAWTDIPAANVNHPNPDREQPFFVHWDVSAVADRAYDLRAVASDVLGASDPAPGTITVLVDSVGFEVKETDLGNGKVKKEQAVSNETSNTIATAESGSAVVTKVVLPAGALNTTDATLSATANPPALPPAPAAATSLGASIEITLSNGQSQLSNGQTAAIVFNYPDDNGDGVIDGTQVRAENAEIQTFDVPTNKWKKEFATVVDKDKKTLTGQTPHFSFFAAFGVLAANLDAIRVYPNPYKPNGGNADEGRPFSRADPLSGVIFDNLPTVVTIKIYTLTGRLVSEFGTSAGTGALQWDGKNDQGEDVASGGYFAVITSPGSSPLVKKIGVIR